MFTVLTHVAVEHAGEVVDASPGADGAVLDLGMRPQLYPGREHGIRTDPAVGPTRTSSPSSHPSRRDSPTTTRSPGSDVVEDRHRPDLAARTEHGRPRERGHGMDDAVHANHDRLGSTKVVAGSSTVTPESMSASRVRRRRAASAAASWRRSLMKMNSSGSGATQRLHRPGEQLDDVGEVVLALRVGGGQAVERRPELGAVEDVDPAVALHRHRLARAGGRAPRRCAGRGRRRRGRPGPGRTDRRGCRAAGCRRAGDEACAARSRCERLGRDQRGVADDDQDRTVAASGCRNAAERVAGAERRRPARRRSRRPRAGRGPRSRRLR